MINSPPAILAGHAHLARSGLPVALLLFALVAYLGNLQPFFGAALLLTATAEFTFMRPGRRGVLFGHAALALAHLLYVLLFVALSGAPLWVAFATTPPLALLVVALAACTEIWLSPYAGRLRWPVRGYVALTAAMLLAALNTAPPGAILAGATVLAASDVLRAVLHFRPTSGTRLRWAARPLIWPLRTTGAGLILWGLTVV